MAWLCPDCHKVSIAVVCAQEMGPDSSDDEVTVQIAKLDPRRLVGHHEVTETDCS